MITGGEQTAATIPLTTRELLAAILLFSEKDHFSERELMEHVANVRMRRPHEHLSSCRRVQLCLSGFLVDGVLRYDGASDRFRYGAHAADYLRDIVTTANLSSLATNELRCLITDAAPERTPIMIMRETTRQGEAR